MNPPVGKSGPRTWVMRSVTAASGSSISACVAATTSRRLWGGMLVAIPTAIPDEPFTSRFGSRDGRTMGSCRWLSKVSVKSTVSLSMSASSSWAMAWSRASV